MCAAMNILLGGFGSPESSITQNEANYWLRPNPLKQIFIHTISVIRYRLRHNSKSRQRTKLETVSKLRTLPSSHENENSIFLAFGPEPESQHRQYGSFLTYDLLMLIVRELHYVDVINLSLVSRGLRGALLLRADVAARTQALRNYTCEGSKSECSICGNQICSVSQYERATRLLLILWFSHARRSATVPTQRHFVTSRVAELSALNATIIESVWLENPSTHTLAVWGPKSMIVANLVFLR